MTSRLAGLASSPMAWAVVGAVVLIPLAWPLLLLLLPVGALAMLSASSKATSAAAAGAQQVRLPSCALLACLSAVAPSCAIPGNLLRVCSGLAARPGAPQHWHCCLTIRAGRPWLWLPPAMGRSRRQPASWARHLLACLTLEV